MVLKRVSFEPEGRSPVDRRPLMSTIIDTKHGLTKHPVSFSTRDFTLHEMSVTPTWFNNAVVNSVPVTASSPIGFRAHRCKYLGIDFSVSADMTLFRVEDFIKPFNSRVNPKTDKTEYSKSWKTFANGAKQSSLMTKYGNSIVTTTGSRDVKGNYLPWRMFNSILYWATDFANADAFEHGEELDLSTPGYLYLVQPEKGDLRCVGTSTFKYGRTWNMDQRLIGYGPETDVYSVVHVDDMVLGEHCLMEVVKRFAEGNAPVFQREYFEMESLDVAIRAFEEAMDELRSRHGTTVTPVEH